MVEAATTGSVAGTERARKRIKDNYAGNSRRRSEEIIKTSNINNRNEIKLQFFFRNTVSCYSSSNSERIEHLPVSHVLVVLPVLAPPPHVSSASRAYARLLRLLLLPSAAGLPGRNLQQRWKLFFKKIFVDISLSHLLPPWPVPAAPVSAWRPRRARLRLPPAGLLLLVVVVILVVVVVLVVLPVVPVWHELHARVGVELVPLRPRQPERPSPPLRAQALDHLGEGGQAGVGGLV